MQTPSGCNPGPEAVTFVGSPAWPSTCKFVRLAKKRLMVVMNLLEQCKVILELPDQQI